MTFTCSDGHTWEADHPRPCPYPGCRGEDWWRIKADGTRYPERKAVSA